ncbi:prolyl oligopeptidase family serine peptidase [Brachybacterium halotolerans subsp. kimchii]|uniref:prolyl oligopeptidase family serine peptidase n=1 Tax=Brachybacterium halotolerans TaxID=2795215 RepID=UPI001E394BDF|nr:prolyl oligopeptidase family serine peptidase [Brachybacterium halotolerans]UEJ81201.1 prolyl oligopeptidase family serine peptidase [Brachybacterium halotolerans subsp. kimchii]
MTTTLPYGTWPSPITAQQLATGGARLGGPVFVGEQLWWLEGIAAEGGRQAIVRTADPVATPTGAGGRSPAPAPEDAGTVTVLPAPFNARSRVHEYGGGSWAAIPDALVDEDPAVLRAPLVLFVNFDDQRVYAFTEGSEPRPLTPVGPEVESAHGPSLRWACPTPVTLADGSREVWWICEDHTGGAEGPRTDPDGAPHIERFVAAVPLDGSAAVDPGAIRRVTPASRFVAYPRLSPDGTRVAWISWEHPQMPWDGTLLHVAPLIGGSAGTGEIVAGGPSGPVGPGSFGGPGGAAEGDREISVLQPEWLDDERLMFVSDESGWWNPRVWSAADGSRAVLPADSPFARQEFGGAMWGLGTTWYAVLDADHVLAAHGHAGETLGMLTISSGEVVDLDLPLTSIAGMDVCEDGGLVLLGASPARFSAIYLTRIEGGFAAPHMGALRQVRSSRDDAPDPDVLPSAEEIEVPLPDGGTVHAIWFAPRQSGIEGPADELPPVIARVHGGPTSAVPPVLSLPVAYYTSRGIGVVEVNYGGSTGYGRAYRDRLKGQWGVVDVADTVAVMDHLVASGLADGRRLGIEGGSAGGWTTLACLTRTSTFSAGVSSFGVAELENFIRDTHDFESRYIDGLVGPYPERKDLYAERAPLSHVDELECPVLLLQGDEDRIVPPSQSEMFRDALAAKGIPHAYLLFHGEQHGFRKAESIIRATESSLSFYGQVFGFTPPGVPVLELVTR